MAERNPLHQPSDQQRGLEAGINSYDPPLLPYEVALIEALGCSEREYREFIRHAELRARVRPAEYAHIPEIGNETTSMTLAIISLVLGVASTVASILLAPKAPTLAVEANAKSAEKIKGKRLADQIGPTRFNQTTSFDNVASLAELGQVIPVPFGRPGTGSDGLLTGGLTIAPSLVWSRCFSKGSYQVFEGLYVVGQAGMDAPEIAGVRVGTVALNSVDVRDYALYWSSQTGENFPNTKIAGTEPSGRDVFTAPSSSGEDRYGFSMAYNPTSKTQFGTSTPIHNGTGYRFNWEIISAPIVATRDDGVARADAKARRRKIAGKGGDVIENAALPERRGQPGVGREYSRKMGITTYNGSRQQYRRVINSVSVDDTCVFEINGGNWKAFAETDFFINGDFDTEVNLEDLGASADSWRIRATDLLTLGSKWVIGNCVWVVEKRSKTLWKPGENMEITLRCTEVLGVSSLGLTGYQTLIDNLAGYDGDFFDSRTRIGPGWWNLCAFNDALVRPVRRDARAIEIGIRSQVWNRASGLCNFNAVPTPYKLVDLDQRNISLNTPRMDKYFARTSCFSIMVRPVAAYGEEQKPWRRIPKVFVITGQSPVDQFNYIRIEPQSSDYFEYRLVPRSGTDIWINSDDNERFVRLNAQANNEITLSLSNAYGGFLIKTTGEDDVRKVDVASCREMYSLPGERSTVATTSGPGGVSFVRSYGNGGTREKANSLQAWLTEVLGQAYAAGNRNRRQTGSFVFTGGGRSITVTVSATSRPVAENPVYIQMTGSNYNWDSVNYEVTAFTGNWGRGDRFTYTVSATGINDIARYWSYSSMSVEFEIPFITTTYVDSDGIDISSRAFEDNTQLVDVSHYLELTKSNESGPEHEIVYVNEFIQNKSIPTYYDLSTIGLSIKSSSKISSIGQLRAWMPSGIRVLKALTLDEGFTNRFAEIVYYLLTNKTQGVGNTVPAELVDLESLQATALFQRENKIFFDGVLEDVQNIRSFIYENAALHLCNFTIKNGRFGLIPAVPYEASGKISTQPIAVEQIFTAGNIIADSLQVNYIDASQRTNFRAVVMWRVTTQNDLPAQSSAFLNWADLPVGERATTQQTFDLTDFCTNREQALLTARFLMSTRRRVTHTISFKTTPAGLAIEPGSYIRVITESTSYSANNNGVITDAGTLVAVNTVEDGTYSALVYNPATSEVIERQITVSGGSVSDSSLYGTIFTLLSTKVSKGVYQIDQITLDKDGLVDISAVHVPVDAQGASIVVQDILTPTRFIVAE